MKYKKMRAIIGIFFAQMSATHDEDEANRALAIVIENQIVTCQPQQLIRRENRPQGPVGRSIKHDFEIFKTCSEYTCLSCTTAEGQACWKIGAFVACCLLHL